MYTEPLEVIRTNDREYIIDGKIIDGTDELRNTLADKLGIDISLEQMRFIVRKRYVPEFILRVCPNFKYEDQYSGEVTNYAPIHQHHPAAVNDTQCVIQVRRIRTVNGKVSGTECDYKDHNRISITKLAEFLQEDGINLTMGQIRHMINYGKTDAMNYKYPHLEFQVMDVQLEKDRRGSEKVDDSSSSDKEALIERTGDIMYCYNGKYLSSIQLREELEADGFIINKNTLSMMFGQGKIPKSVAERYPNLKYRDCR